MYKLTEGDKINIIADTLYKNKDNAFIKKETKRLKQLKLKKLNAEFKRVVNIIDKRLNKNNLTKGGEDEKYTRKRYGNIKSII